MAGEQIALSGILEPGAESFGENSGRFAVAVVLLLVGLEFVTAWLMSAVRSVRMLEGRRQRRTLVGLFAAGCLAVAPWFATWAAFRHSWLLTEFATFGETGSGLYGHVSAVVNAVPVPLNFLLSNPLALPASAPGAAESTRRRLEPPARSRMGTGSSCPTRRGRCESARKRHRMSRRGGQRRTA